MSDIARKNDRTFGTCSFPGHGPQYGKVTTASSTVFAGGKLVTRLTDTVTADCGHTGIIDTSSNTVYAEGKKVARKGDHFSGVYTGNIIEGEPTVTAG